MTPHHLLVYAALAFAGVGLYSSIEDTPASLASDVGVSDANACDAIAQYSEWAVARLEASGFPHASDAPRETYRLTRTDKGTVEAAITIDWIDRHAACAPLDANTPYTVSFDMNAKAYLALVGELSSVVSTGDVSNHAAVNAAWIAFGTSVTNPDGSTNDAYRGELRSWAAGRLVQGAR